MKTGPYILKHLAGTSVFYLILFISAGRIDYWQGWVYFLIGLVMVALNYTVLAVDPALLEERSKPGEGAKKWDRSILGLSFLILVAQFITAGLDSGRFHWSSDFHWSLYVLGAILTIAGQLLFLLAQKQNPFFSSTMRIQTDRGHTVCETGLYKFVRHPAYLGNIIQTIGFPLLFGSVWSILPAGISILLVCVRTYLEDKTLTGELKGYREYTRKTRYRILPYVW
ncbi:MAG: isoprenylcysteine carboxylmethyltransferase family protein [Lewinellaceae bacterium]|nr:isoprenylcysteine carboxylmethyltransferase family protein [Lewinellaceae bacterium]